MTVRRAVAALLSAAVLAGCSAAAQSPAPARPQPQTSNAAVEGERRTLPAMQGTPVGAKWEYRLTESYAPYLKQLGGATWYEVTWCDVEPEPGAVDWKKVDRVVAQTRDVGMTMLLKLRVGSCWATGGRGQLERGVVKRTESLMPRDLAAYERFVREAVRRYSAQGVHSYAVENEVNGEGFWGGSPEELVRLVTAAAAVIRAEDAEAVVVDPGLSSTAYGHGIAQRLLDEGQADEAVAAYTVYYQRRFPRRKELPQVRDVDDLRAALDTDQARRNLTYLRAVRELAHSGVVDVWQLHFYEKWTNVPALLDYLRAVVPEGMPVEGWEVGMFWPDGAPDPRVRTEEMSRTVTGLLDGGVRRVIWLPLAFDPDDPKEEELRYGVLDERGSPREAGQRLLEIAQERR